jgi:hypothetical protein
MSEASRNPSRLKKVAISWLIFSATLFAWAVLGGSRFFVSPGFSQASWWPILGISVAVGFMWRKYLVLEAAERGTKPVSALFGFVVIVPAVGFVLGYMPLSWGLPRLLNRAFGEHTVGIYHVSESARIHGRGGYCNFIAIKELRHYSFGRLCAVETDFRPGDLIRVEGVRSWAGFEVNSYARK